MEKNFVITGIEKVILVEKDKYPEKRTVFTHNLSKNELIFHFSGNSNVYFNGKVLSTTENTIRFLPKGENKEYIVEKETFGECIDVFFNTDVPISEEAFVITPNNTAKVKSLFKKIFFVWISKNSGYYFECMSLLYQIFSEIQKDDYIPENQYSKLKPAIEYIEENFSTGKITTKHLADICKISESYLKKLFIKKFGLPPVKYIIQLKINYACDLLSSGLYNITCVSEMCGYADMYFFSHQFKEYVGISPSEFIKRQKADKVST